jgi:hypothetical protein
MVAVLRLLLLEPPETGKAEQSFCQQWIVRPRLFLECVGKLADHGWRTRD